MRKLDYFLQKWRYSVAMPLIPSGCDLLDIGGYDGSFLKRVYEKIRHGVCIDPHLEERSNEEPGAGTSISRRCCPVPGDVAVERVPPGDGRRSPLHQVREGRPVRTEGGGGVHPGASAKEEQGGVNRQRKGEGDEEGDERNQFLDRAYLSP